MYASGGISYEWFPKTAIDDPFVFNPVVSPDVTTDYTVEITDINGCKNRSVVNVEVSDMRTSISADKTICAGETVELFASGGNRYEWSSPETLDNFRRARVNASPSVTTIYTAEITQDDCTVTETVTVNVAPAPMADAGPRLAMCIDDDPVDLRIGALPAGGSFSSSSGGVNGVLFDPGMVPGAGIYFVDYAVKIGSCTAKATREIEISDGPSLRSPREDYIICPGEAVQLDMASTGASHIWSPAEGLSNKDVLNPMASPPVTTTYTLVSTDANGCVNSMDVVVTVKDNSINAGRPRQLCIDAGSIDLSNELNGSWSGTGVVKNRFFPDIADVGDHWIRVSAMSRSGCSGLDSVRYTVLGRDAITFIEEELMVCQNDNVIDLNQNVNVVGASWDGIGVDRRGIFDPSDVAAGTYPIKVQYENASDCEAMAFMSVQVIGLPAIQAGPSINLCPDDMPVSLEETATPADGSFFGSGIDSDGLFDPALSGSGDFEIIYRYTDLLTNCTAEATRTVTVLEPDNVIAGSPISICINAGSVNLSGNASPSGGVFSGPAVNGSHFFPASAGIGTHVVAYTVTSASGCSASATREITVNEEAVLDLQGPESYCANEGPINLEAFPSIPGGTWSGQSVEENFFRPENAGSGTHILTYFVETADGCELSETKIVTVLSVNDIDIGADINSCLGGSTINLLGNFNGASTAIAGDGVSSNIFYPDIAGAGTHNIRYAFANVNGCTTIREKQIIVQREVFVAVAEDLVLCTSAGSLDLSERGFPVGEGAWSGEGVTLNEFNLDEVGAGSYELTYTVNQGNGCVNAGVMSVEVIDSGLGSLGRDSIVCVNSGEIALNFREELRNGLWEGPGVVNNIFFPNVSGPGVHQLLYSNTDFACDILGQRNITVLEVPPTAVSDQTTVSGCVGDIVRLTASLPEASANISVNYNWYRETDDTGSPFETGKTIHFQIEGNENIFFASVNQFGCEPGERNFIRIRANGPIGDFEVDKKEARFGELVGFKSNVSNTAGYRWSFGDGSVSTEANPFYLYYSAGEKTVTMNLTSADGCELAVVKEDIITIIGPENDVPTEPVLNAGKESYELQLSPVPASDMIRVSIKQGVFEGETITISDQIGRKVITEGSLRGKNEHLIDLKDLSSGVYLLDITNKNGSVERKRFTVLR